MTAADLVVSSQVVGGLHEETSDHRANNSDSANAPAEPESRFGRGLGVGTSGSLRAIETPSQKKRAFLIRTLALLCACSLSVGVHYSTYILGPLKSKIQRELGTTHTEFGLLFSAYNLNSTWTPLVAGLLASRLGTTVTSILATGVVFLGQFLLLVGELSDDIKLMALGLFIFGFGASPLAVVQETIIVRFFKSHGIGVSMALGLVAGKGASFLAARTAYPLTEHFGTSAPFYVATFFTGFSVVVNLIYIASSRWLVDGAGAEFEAPDFVREARQVASTDAAKAQELDKTAEKRKVHLKQIAKFGDVFWAYVLLNVLCGMIWHPFTHLAANIIEKRYHLAEGDSANKASYLLAGSILLYPICGFIVDTLAHRPIIVYLLFSSSILTASAYAWLVLPPTWTHTPLPAIVSFAFGHGFSPLLLVVIVPKIVAPKYISTALGVHKSLEQTGTILFQTLAGLFLDLKSRASPASTAIQQLLNIFLLLNCLQALSILLLAFLQWRGNTPPKNTQERRMSVASDDRHSRAENSAPAPSSQSPLISGTTVNERNYGSPSMSKLFGSRMNVISIGEVQRGRVFAWLAFLLVISAWILFMETAYHRLGRAP
ncbi:MFS general substrate transporter [Macrolepiota fuliginosa MF-IS2]|uniref:Lysosomal dipeptide transporter MFSD1 n=1 Tax=Macrolepiota fuliginosa MF-IS2 TaxID=1400762 RepID=A0A9P5XNS1_9AGAR|nr:MFS general substrate transporter [Macrolepiota fuliginosa MF-IS2]